MNISTKIAIGFFFGFVAGLLWAAVIVKAAEPQSAVIDTIRVSYDDIADSLRKAIWDDWAEAITDPNFGFPDSAWYDSTIASFVIVTALRDMAFGESTVPFYIDVEFISIEKLDVCTDSILNICYTDSSYYLVNGLGKPWWNYHQVCRYFISREIWWMPEEPRPGIWTQMPTNGKARIFYGERIKEE